MTDKEMDFSEQELFDGAVADEPVQDAPADQNEPAEVEQPSSQPRDESGRFAKAEAEEPEANANPDERIPKWRREEIAAEKNRAVDEAKAARDELARERAEKAELARRLQALEKPSKPAEQVEAKPDPLLDPEGYAAYVERKIEERILNDRREESLARAHGKYKEEFEEAYNAAKERIDPALKAKMQASRDPGETLIQWHREQKTVREIGGDLNSFKQKLREEALKDPEFRKLAMEAWRSEANPRSVNGRPNVDIPPSLNGVSRSNSALRAAEQNQSDSDLWNELAG